MVCCYVPPRWKRHSVFGERRMGMSLKHQGAQRLKFFKKWKRIEKLIKYFLPYPIFFLKKKKRNYLLSQNSNESYRNKRIAHMIGISRRKLPAHIALRALRRATCFYLRDTDPISILDCSKTFLHENVIVNTRDWQLSLQKPRLTRAFVYSPKQRSCRGSPLTCTALNLPASSPARGRV